MHHGQLTLEALRFRLDTLQPENPGRFDIEQAADVAVASGDPVIDRALRIIGEAWLDAGLPSDRPGLDPSVRELFDRRPDLVDALDDIIRQVRHQTRRT
jgi:hypothetical protein